MTVIWTKHAKFSFNEELEFIVKKWNEKEVEGFIQLVDDFIKKLKTGILQGKISPKTNIRSFVISKQTTLFFTINENSKTIVLLLFWNNLKDPKNLKDKLSLY